MAYIQNILVAVDLHHGDRIASRQLSDESQAAVTQAMELAATWDATVTFISVLEISAQSQSMIEHDHENIFKTVEDVANEVLTELVQSANRQRIPAESILRFGIAAAEIAKEVATTTVYDLVVLGSRSHSRATTILFGSTAQKLVRTVACPVWIAKPAAAKEIREVAIATDLSQECLPALHFAVSAARAIDARLHLLHAPELSDFRYLVLAGVADDVLQQTEARLRQSAEEKLRNQLYQTDFRTLPHGVKIELANGSVDQAIVDYVIHEGIDVLVIGSHGHQGIIDSWLGTTAERILQSAPTSVIVVKPLNFSHFHTPS